MLLDKLDLNSKYMPTTQGEALNQEKKRDRRMSRGRRKPKQDSEFDQKIIDVARVTRVTEGGKQMSFRATVAVGDKKNRVGIGNGKGKDVSAAINKAVNQAKKNLIAIPITDQGTVPHEVKTKYGSAIVMMRPATQGTGIIAGGVMRMIFELSGIKNIVAKMYGSKNKINNARATMDALSELQDKEARKASHS